MTAAIDFDHVAIGVSRVQPYLDLLVGTLGAELKEGGVASGFRALQVTMGTRGMTVELLEPWAVDENDFLARFLDRRGEGPHHLTFKVPDLRAEIDRLRGLGIEPVQIDMSNSMWMECFLMPDVAHGTVVQLAQSGFEGVDLSNAPEPVGGWMQRWWEQPPPAAPDAVTLAAVVMASPDPGATSSFFRDVLQGVVTNEGAGPRVTWPCGGTIMIEQGGAAPRIDRLATDRPPAVAIGSARFVPAP